ncbi:fumarylacetoacetate hydrolase family protein [Frigidibacter sp. MR17.14]|uniref:fumarylacetoacetate hydrolase family protein n=1 Tax=Frigidibacter sp. MR17.14 TaxID=3126509 RepID=UPI003012F291
MKLVRYGDKGSEKPGMLDAAGRVRDLSAVIPDLAGESLSPGSLRRLAALDPETLPLVEGAPQAGLRLGSCVARPPKFIAIGLNFADHAAETGAPVPKEPIVFSKWTSCLAGPDDTVVLPRDSVKTDWEVELGVVIGTGGSYIPEARALDHVAGYCLVNDISEREWQAERGGTWDKGKGFDGFGPVGPWLVTPDEAGDVADLRMWCEVSGEMMQDGSSKTMIFKVPEIITYVSRFLTLEPGDIITTGTPPGVGLGKTPPRFLRAGDVMRLGIDGLGTQTQKVVAAG